MTRVLLCLALAGCSRVGDDPFFDGTPDASPPEPALSWLGPNLFTPRCATCHTGGEFAGGLMDISMDLRGVTEIAALGFAVGSRAPYADIARLRPADVLGDRTLCIRARHAGKFSGIFENAVTGVGRDRNSPSPSYLKRGGQWIDSSP